MDIWFTSNSGERMAAVAEGRVDEDGGVFYYYPEGNTYGMDPAWRFYADKARWKRRA